MQRITKNQSGFGAVEALLILIIVILIGVVGWLVYKDHNKTPANASTTTSTKTATAATTPDPYAGWQQYCSSHEKACFKYPSSWTAKPDCGGPCTDFDSVNLTSPSNTFVSFTSAETGVGGDCDPTTTPHVIYNVVEPLSKVPGVYFIESSRADIDGIELGLMDSSGGQKPTTGDTGRCLDYLMFDAKNTPYAKVWFHGHVADSAKADDLTTAELIVKSYYYQ